MLNFNLWENINLNFAECCGRKCKTMGEDETTSKVIRDGAGTTYDITMLPVAPDFDITNLYSHTTDARLWNTFVIGNDMTYIHASINDPHTKIPLANALPNTRGKGLPNELVMLFDALWTKTLAGKHQQMFMVWNGKLYITNTYPLTNSKSKNIIGAVMFMRAFENNGRPRERESRPRMLDFGSLGQWIPDGSLVARQLPGFDGGV